MKRKRNILITAGGTREYIDPVRFIANASSGKMGYALARAAIKAGFKVTLISAPSNLRPPKEAKVIDVVTSGQMFKTVQAEFETCDCLIMAAAVSDYKPATSSAYKIKKDQAVMTLKLARTKDVLKWVGRNKKAAQIIVGFALEDTNLLANAEKKLKSKKLDMIVANEPSAIGADRSTLHIKTKNADWQTFEDITKTASAKRIISRLQDI
ncbi:MAG: phosphopantothenoylcysteine decarboxylase [Planctomycetes bacterium]|nr:phosphopantothenoylcysteine decarboxylase [Planctomycetota bacterium]